ncbi:hypothetical protein, partial [Aquifex sp.]
YDRERDKFRIYNPCGEGYIYADYETGYDKEDYPYLIIKGNFEKLKDMCKELGPTDLLLDANRYRICKILPTDEEHGYRYYPKYGFKSDTTYSVVCTLWTVAPFEIYTEGIPQKGRFYVFNEIAKNELVNKIKELCSFDNF